MAAADWLRYAVPLAGLASALAIALALRGIGRQWQGRWAAMRAQPRALQWAAGLVLALLALRLARAGWRPLVVFVLVLALAGAWGEFALRRRR